MRKRGQIGVEYMVVVAFVTIITLSIFVVSQYHSEQAEEIITANQLDAIAREIVDTAESMYYFGEPSRSTLNVYIPKGIKSVTIGPNELSFTIRSQGGTSDISYPTDVTLQGNVSISAGLRAIQIEARGGYVWINGT